MPDRATLQETLLGWLRALLPQACPGCGSQLGAQTGLCPRCRSGLKARVESHSPLQPRPTPHLVTLGEYRGVRRRAVRALKFGRVRDLAGVLGVALADGVPTGWNIRAVVPVPLHPARQRQRGFNQAELLAQAIAGALGVPCVSALSRTRATAQQSRQRASGRGHMHGAFAARLSLSGPVLLVDDVLTSGATLLACQETLLDSGVAEVYAAVVAR